MAVFTPVSEADARTFLARYELGALVGLTPIAEGVENTNYRLETASGPYVLTLFEGRTDEAALPFCLGLTDHLARRGYPAPRTVSDRSGGWLGRMNGRAAAIIEWLPGAWLRAPSEREQATAGAALARLHRTAADYRGDRRNPVGPDAWRQLAARIGTAATGEDRQMLERVQGALRRLGEPFTDDLPAGPVHADYFPDNVLFKAGRVAGVIDFYFAFRGSYAYDLAIALSAWGFNAEGRPERAALAAFQGGYEEVRPLTPAERAALPRLGVAAALRFTLTRLHDRVFHDPTRLMTPKDPAPFLRRLDYWEVEIA